MRIAATADLHFISPRYIAIQEQLAQVRDQADLLVLAGDLTNYGKPAEMEELLKSLGRSRIPIVAVLGNHDYESGSQAILTRMLTDEGINVLDGTAYERDGVGFAGTKGFPGGFGRGALTAFGEPEVKAFVQAAIDEATKLERALWISASSALQSAQPARWRRTFRAASATESALPARSGRSSRISTFEQSAIEKLLHRAHRVVIVHSCRAFRRSGRLSDLLVRQPFSDPKREDLALGRRQSPTASQTLLRLVGHDLSSASILRRRVAFLNSHRPAAASDATPVEEQSPHDREQPRAK